MGNQNINAFVNRLIDIGMDSANTKRVINPRVSYVSIEQFRAMTGSDNKIEQKPQDSTTPAAVKAAEPAPVRKPPVVRPAAEDLPYRKPPAVKPAAEDLSYKIDLSDQNLLNGFIMSEVLGRPKCFGRGRRPSGR